MSECFAITTYCNTKEKIDILNQTIENLKQFNIDIMIHAHYPLIEDIQKKVNYYLFSSNNSILPYYNVFWYYIRDYKLEIKVYDTNYTLLKAWTEIINFLKNYDKIHFVNYDANITPEIFNFSILNKDKSIFIQNNGISENHVRNYYVLTYFCLKNSNFNYFKENITLENYLKFNPIDNKFRPMLEEFIPSFTIPHNPINKSIDNVIINDDFFLILCDQYNAKELLKYDIASHSRFDWNKNIKINDIRLFLGQFDDTTKLIILDNNKDKTIEIEVNDKNIIYNLPIVDQYLIDLNIPFINIKNLKIKIDNEYINEDFFKKYFQLECKIYHNI